MEYKMEWKKQKEGMSRQRKPDARRVERTEIICYLICEYCYHLGGHPWQHVRS